MLTSYNGTSITYDAIGNPTKWRNAVGLTWEARELQRADLATNSYVNYVYNSDGIRTSRSYVNANIKYRETRNYILDGTKIIQEDIMIGTITSTTNATLYYLYDASGEVQGFIYNNSYYYFQKNLQGDVVRILNSSGSVVVEYTYDAWGKVLTTTGTMASTVGKYNPFRYRSYYYDTETGFYYLQSRYYDPTVGRFLNADGIVGANGGLQGYNMFTYCNNNPVMYADPSGCMWVPFIKVNVDVIYKVMNEFFDRLSLYLGFVSQFINHGVSPQAAFIMATDVTNHRLDGNDDTILYAYETGGPDYGDYGSGDSVKIAYNATIFVIEGNNITKTYAASTLPQFTVSKEYGDKGGVATVLNGKYSYKFYEQYAHKTNVYHVRNYGTSIGTVPCVRWDKGSGRFIDSTATSILIHDGTTNSRYNKPTSMGCIIVQGSWSDFYSYVGTSSGTLFIYGPNRYN